MNTNKTIKELFDEAWTALHLVERSRGALQWFAVADQCIDALVAIADMSPEAEDEVWFFGIVDLISLHNKLAAEFA